MTIRRDGGTHATTNVFAPMLVAKAVNLASKQRAIVTSAYAEDKIALTRVTRPRNPSAGGNTASARMVAMEVVGLNTHGR